MFSDGSFLDLNVGEMLFSPFIGRMFRYCHILSFWTIIRRIENKRLIEVRGDPCKYFFKLIFPGFRLLSGGSYSVQRGALISHAPRESQRPMEVLLVLPSSLPRSCS